MITILVVQIILFTMPFAGVLTPNISCYLLIVPSDLLTVFPLFFMAFVIIFIKWVKKLALV